MKTPDLAGLLQRRTPPMASPTPQRAVPSEENTPEPPIEKDADAGPSPAAPRSPKPEKRSQARAKDTDVAPTGQVPPAREYLRSVMVYLPRSIHQKLRTRADDEGTTATALILAAVNATHTQLGDLLTRADTKQHHANPGDLFAVPQVRHVAEPRVQTTIRVTDAQHRALGDLTAQHHTNRSKLVVTALREWLR